MLSSWPRIRLLSFDPDFSSLWLCYATPGLLQYLLLSYRPSLPAWLTRFYLLIHRYSLLYYLLYTTTAVGVGIIQCLCCIYPVFTYMYLWRFGISYVASSTWECVRANGAQRVRCNIFAVKIAACELNLGCRNFSLDWDNPRNYNTFYSDCVLLSCACSRP